MSEKLTRLLEVVRELNVTKAMIARKARFSRSHVGSILEGKTPITEKFIAAMAMAFDVSPDWLRGGDGEMFRRSDRDEEESTQSINPFIRLFGDISNPDLLLDLAVAYNKLPRSKQYQRLGEILCDLDATGQDLEELREDFLAEHKENLEAERANARQEAARILAKRFLKQEVDDVSDFGNDMHDKIVQEKKEWLRKGIRLGIKYTTKNLLSGKVFDFKPEEEHIALIGEAIVTHKVTMRGEAPKEVEFKFTPEELGFTTE